LLVLSAVTLAGCFDKPKIEDRWTRVDVLSSSPVPRQTLPPGSMQTITLRTTVTGPASCGVTSAPACSRAA
jgi:hypothetical protein